jgi:hypothetical protein
VPEDQKKAICRGADGCQAYDDFRSLKGHLHERHEKHTEEEFKMTGAVLFNTFIWMQVRGAVTLTLALLALPLLAPLLRRGPAAPVPCASCTCPHVSHPRARSSARQPPAPSPRPCPCAPQVANEINARRIYDELNVFSGILHSPIFLGVLLLTGLFQALIINFLGTFFKVVPLNWQEWLITMAIGAGAWPVSFITRLVTQLVEGRRQGSMPA